MGLAEVIFTSPLPEPVEGNGSGQVAGHAYLHLPGLIVTEAASGTRRYLLSDGLGSVRHVTDEAGQLVSYHEFDPYGVLLTEPAGDPYGYTGEWWQADIGLLHLRARWYDPASGTFLSKDRVESEPPYQYVRGNVTNWTDPSGKDPFDKIWQQAFQKVHCREPEWQDRAIRLFSIAHPNEWDWNAFYNSDGTLLGNEWENIFRSSGNRTWDSVPHALKRLSAYYANDETELLVRDVGTLYGGLLDRFREPNAEAAITGGTLFEPQSIHPHMPSQTWVYVSPGTLSRQLIGADQDSNIHHWGWALMLGYYSKLDWGMLINTAREFQQIEHWNDPTGYTRADIWIGNRAVLTGARLKIFGKDRIGDFVYWDLWILLNL